MHVYILCYVYVVHITYSYAVYSGPLMLCTVESLNVGSLKPT